MAEAFPASALHGYDVRADRLHDVGDPVGALRHAAASLSPGGTVLLVEPYAGDRGSTT